MSRASNATRNNTLRRQRGFTLIELMVSLSIMVVVLGLLGSAIVTLSQGWDRSAARLERIDMLQRAAGLLRRDAKGAQRLVWRDRAPPQFIFSGTSAQVRFVTTEPPYPTQDGLYFVRYGAAANGRGAALVRSRTGYNGAIATLDDIRFTDAVELIDGRYQINFSYGKAGRDGLRWLPAWYDSAQLPDLIRLDIEGLTEDASPIPPMIVRLRADAEQVCVNKTAALCTIKSGGALELKPAAKSTSKGKRR